MDNVMYRISLIPSPPVPTASLFLAECLNKLPENVSQEHFPFLYRDFSLIVF